jgi:hypothetical protein
LKNRIIEQGGPSSYGFFTRSCLTGVSTEFRLPAHEESIESFAQVIGVVEDLAAVAAQRHEAQVIRLTDDDADFVSSYIVDAPPAVCWQYFVEPGKRHRHLSVVETGIEFTPNREGRLAAGASSHCSHGVGGDGFREYLDWRPYEYFTCHLSRVEAEGVEHTFVDGLETYEFIDLGDGRTEHRWLLRADDRTPEGLRAFEEATAFLKEISTHPTWGDQMRRPIAEDAVMYGLDRPAT